MQTYPLNMLWFAKDHRVVKIPEMSDDHLVAILGWMARMDVWDLVHFLCCNEGNFGGYASPGEGETNKSPLGLYRECWRSYDNLLAEATRRGIPIPPELPTEANPMGVFRE